MVDRANSQSDLPNGSQSSYDDLLDAIAAQVESGDSASLSLLLKDNPKHAARLRKAAEAMQAMFEMGLDSVVGQNTFDKQSDSHAAEELINGLLGDYRIIREIGRGGMGIVYEAEQVSLNRQVALKVLPLASTLDERQLLRFRNESYAAASLNHPNIVDAYAVGVERGVHYFAMKYIDGQDLSSVIAKVRSGTLRKHAISTARGPSEGKSHHDRTAAFDADTEQAGVDTRRNAAAHTPTDVDSRSGREEQREYVENIVNFFVGIAKALDYAHQQGIVHRDIKPSNLMLDRSGKGWITDFGLAQMDHAGTMTMTGDIVGTIRYMSPEQAGGERQIIDHRSDVYSLGISLYEALALRPAFEGHDRVALIRQVREEDPTHLGALNRSIPRALQTIIHKAISKRPDDRYATAQAFAEDLERFQTGEPIRATSPSVMQRLVSWGRKHPTIVSSISVSALVAVVGLSVASLLLWQEQTKTQQALNDTEAARQTARNKADEAESVLDFLINDLLLSAKPEKSLGRPTTVQEILSEAEQQVDGAFGDRPLVKASVQQALATVHNALGNWKAAEARASSAWELRQEHLGESHPDTLRSLLTLATATTRLGQIDDARSLFLSAKQKCEEQFVEPELLTCKAVFGLSQCDYIQGDYQAALRLCDTLLEIDGDPMDASGIPFKHSVRNSRSLTLAALGKPDLALVEQKSLCGDIAQLQLDDHPTALRFKSVLASLYLKNHQVEAAKQMYNEIIEGRGKVYGATARTTLGSRKDLAILKRKTGDFQEAKNELLELVEMVEAEFGPDDDLMRSCYVELGPIALAVGEFENAKMYTSKAVELYTRDVGAGHPNTLIARRRLAEIFAALGDYEEALAEIESVVQLSKEELGTSHFRTLAAKWLKGDLLVKAGRNQEGLSVYKEVLLTRQNEFGRYDNDTLVRTRDYARALRNAGRFEEAIDLYRSTLENSSGELIDSFRMNFSSWLGFTLFSVGRFEEAAGHHHDAYGIAFESEGECSELTMRHEIMWAYALARSSRFEEGSKLLQTLLDRDCTQSSSWRPQASQVANMLVTTIADLCEDMSIAPETTVDQLQAVVGLTREALRYLQKAKSVDGRAVLEARARRRLSVALLRLDSYEEALQELLLGNELHPGEPIYAFIEAAAYSSMGDSVNSIRRYKIGEDFFDNLPKPTGREKHFRDTADQYRKEARNL